VSLDVLVAQTPLLINNKRAQPPTHTNERSLKHVVATSTLESHAARARTQTIKTNPLDLSGPRARDRGDRSAAKDTRRGAAAMAAHPPQPPRSRRRQQQHHPLRRRADPSSPSASSARRTTLALVAFAIATTTTALALSPVYDEALWSKAPLWAAHGPRAGGPRADDVLRGYNPSDDALPLPLRPRLRATKSDADHTKDDDPLRAAVRASTCNSLDGPTDRRAESAFPEPGAAAGDDPLAALFSSGSSSPASEAAAADAAALLSAARLTPLNLTQSPSTARGITGSLGSHGLEAAAKAAECPSCHALLELAWRRYLVPDIDARRPVNERTVREALADACAAGGAPRWAAERWAVVRLGGDGNGGGGDPAATRGNSAGTRGVVARVLHQAAGGRDLHGVAAITLALPVTTTYFAVRERRMMPLAAAASGNGSSSNPAAATPPPPPPASASFSEEDPFKYDPQPSPDELRAMERACAALALGGDAPSSNATPPQLSAAGIAAIAAGGETAVAKERQVALVSALLLKANDYFQESMALRSRWVKRAAEEQVERAERRRRRRLEREEREKEKKEKGGAREPEEEQSSTTVDDDTDDSEARIAEARRVAVAAAVRERRALRRALPPHQRRRRGKTNNAGAGNDDDDDDEGPDDYAAPDEAEPDDDGGDDPEARKSNDKKKQNNSRRRRHDDDDDDHDAAHARDDDAQNTPDPDGLSAAARASAAAHNLVPHRPAPARRRLYDPADLDGGRGVPSAALRGADGFCGDLHVLCPAWAAAGECSANPRYMVGKGTVGTGPGSVGRRAHCALSCGLCRDENALDGPAPWPEVSDPSGRARRELRAAADNVASALRELGCAAARACFPGSVGGVGGGAAMAKDKDDSGAAASSAADAKAAEAPPPPQPPPTTGVVRVTSVEAPVPGALLAALPGFVLGKPFWAPARLRAPQTRGELASDPSLPAARRALAAAGEPAWLAAAQRARGGAAAAAAAEREAAAVVASPPPDRPRGAPSDDAHAGVRLAEDAVASDLRVPERGGKKAPGSAAAAAPAPLPSPPPSPANPLALAAVDGMDGFFTYEVDWRRSVYHYHLEASLDEAEGGGEDEDNDAARKRKKKSSSKERAAAAAAAAMRPRPPMLRGNRVTEAWLLGLYNATATRELRLAYARSAWADAKSRSAAAASARPPALLSPTAAADNTALPDLATNATNADDDALNYYVPDKPLALPALELLDLLPDQPGMAAAGAWPFLASAFDGGDACELRADADDGAVAASSSKGGGGKGQDDDDNDDDDDDDEYADGDEEEEVGGKGQTAKKKSSKGGGASSVRRPRRVELRAACSPDGDVHLLVREPKFCSYVMVLYSPALCRLPAFLPHDGGGSAHAAAAAPAPTPPKRLSTAGAARQAAEQAVVASFTGGRGGSGAASTAAAFGQVVWARPVVPR
jgi:hypothetical protein